MADNLQASPQSPALAALARMLRTARSAGDTVTIPYLGGVGTMMLGKAPEEVTEWSYGNAPMQVPQMTRIPQFKKDRAESLADTLFAAQAAAPLAKAAPQAARALAPSAGALALEAAARTGMPVHGLGVVKPKGGNWLAGSVEKAVEPLKRYRTAPANREAELLAEIDEATRMGAPGYLNAATADLQGLKRDTAVDKWLETKLSKYLKNEMATPEDPLRALAERGVSHIPARELEAVTEWMPSTLEGRRTAAGFPSGGMSTTTSGQGWEQLADEAIQNLPAGARLSPEAMGGQNLVDKYLQDNPWLAKVPPETMTYGVYPREVQSELGFSHLVDELRNAVNPESGLPANLLWKYGDLEKVTVPHAVQRVHDINQWRAAQMLAAKKAAREGIPVHKEYPEGYKWMAAPDVSSDERALKYVTEVGCEGGWCTQSPGTAQHYGSGGKKLYVLHNPKGEAVTQIAVAPGEGGTYTREFRHWAGQEGYDLTDPAELEHARATFAGQSSPLESIVEIKGKANRAPKEEHLPYIQDFVRSGKWSHVGDLENTGLVQLPDKRFITKSQLDDAIQRMSGEDGPSVTPEWFMRQIQSDPSWWEQSKGAFEGFAEGGLVDGASEYNPLEVDYILNNIHGYAQGGVVTQQVKAPFNEFNMNYDINPVEIGHAEGGSVESAHIPYDEAKISSLVNALREELHA